MAFVLFTKANRISKTTWFLCDFFDDSDLAKEQWLPCRLTQL